MLLLFYIFVIIVFLWCVIHHMTFELQIYKKLQEMGTNYQKISSSDYLFSEICQLYIDSFPADERRSINQLKQILDSNSKFSIVAATNDDEFEGFASFWRFDEFVYIEHLAVNPNLRNRGVGKKFVEYIQGCFKNDKIVIEVEPDTDSLTHRRIGFYIRLGFALRKEVKYIQPPYSSNQNSLELWLMTYGDCTDEQLAKYAETIRKEVYYDYQ